MGDYLSRQGLKGRVRRAALALALIGIAGTARAEVPSDVFVMAFQIDDVISLDPAELFEFTGAEIAANIYDRLLFYDNDDVEKIIGGVADEWRVSRDGKTFRFHIHPGMTFQSGNPVTAEDAAYSLRRVVWLNKAPAFILAQLGFTPENAAATIFAADPETLVMETGRAYAPSFVYACLTSAVASIVDGKLVKSHEEIGDYGNQWLRTRSAGSGAFRLRLWKPNELIILDRFETYWRGTSAMRSVFIRHIAEPGVQRLLIERGDIDVARNLGPDQVLDMAGRTDMRVRYARKGALYYLGLNQKNEFLRRPAVRKALKYLVDYDGIANTLLRGKAQVHETIIPGGFLGALDDRPFAFDPGAAKNLLRAAGVEGGVLSLDVRNVRPDLDIAQSIQASFAEAGIEVQILPGDGKQVLTKYRARNHDLYFGRWGPDYQDPHTNAQGFASNPDNSDQGQTKTLAWRNAWDIPDLTNLTGEAVKERDRGRRIARYQEIQRRMLDDSPFVILFQEVDMAVERANVHNFVLGPSFDTVSYRGVTKN